MININTKDYWDKRFGTGDWEDRGGRQQTHDFAVGLSRHIDLGRSFTGTILDFGCGLGDAIPVLRQRFPHAQLLGIDVSERAIEQCRRRYGELAEFRAGNHEDVPAVDVIVASNVLEHLSDDQTIAKALLIRCRHLFIQVPYRQEIVPGTEHVNSYDDRSFDRLGVHCRRIFACRGWSEYGCRRWIDIHLRNIQRLIGRIPRASRSRQILYHLIRSFDAE